MTLLEQKKTYDGSNAASGRECGVDPWRLNRNRESLTELTKKVPSAAVTQDEREILYGLDEAAVMLPYEMCESASKAKYRGWQELDAMGMIAGVFDPRHVTAHVRWMYRYTDNPFAELTHRYGDQMTPGAYKVWSVEVDPAWG